MHQFVELQERTHFKLCNLIVNLKCSHKYMSWCGSVGYMSVKFSHLPHMKSTKLHVNELLDVWLHRWFKVI